MIEIPGYSIRSEISSGPNATVLLAEQSSLGRDVALKVMAPALVADAAQVERFLQIARALASFAHPNIVAVYDVGTTPTNLPYYSMAYLAGGDFATRAQRAFSEPDLTETLAGIARALGYIHQRGLIHRAVSPHNVLYDAYNTPVLINFSVALTASQESYVTNAGFAIDVGRYMSPEQARGGEQDARSDIYSLGALAFYGLTGRPPYDGADGFAIAYAHVFEPIPRLPPAQAHWQPLIDRALAKDPKDRFSSVDEFLDALTNVALDRDAAQSVAAPAAAAAAEAPAAAAVVAVERSAPAAPATVVAKTIKVPTPEPAAGAAAPSLLRYWPVAAALLGIALIAAALLLPKKTPEPPPPPIGTTAPAAPAEPGATASTASPASEPTAPASEPATAPAEAPAEAATTGDTAAAGDTASGGMLDEAIAEAEALAMDPSKAPTVVDPLPESIRLGRIDLAAQRLTSPPGKNALERFQFALTLDPKSKQARQGIVDVAKKLLAAADKLVEAKPSGAAAIAAVTEQLDAVTQAARLVPEGAEVLRDAAARRRRVAEPLIAEAKAAAESWDKAAAKQAYESALKVDPDNAAARDGLKYVATIGEPGFGFRDGAGPPMVVLPGATLAMARHPVTRAEFRRFWDAGGRAQAGKADVSCRDRESIFRSSKKRGWENPDIAQDDNHPVVCVGWAEAAAYAQWLAKTTGKRYRLPTPAEFDRVAARAGAGSCSSGNFADAAYRKQFESRDGSDCDDGYAATSPVEKFGAIEGIYDIDGNVREWVGACGNGAAAAAGSSCRDFMVKGRSWLSQTNKESATFKDNYGDDVSLNTVGFRVVRDLSN